MALPETRSSGLAVGYDTTSAAVGFGVQRLQRAWGAGRALRVVGIKEMPERGGILISWNEQDGIAGRDPRLRTEGFQIFRNGGRTFVLARDEAGAMYGVMDLAEQITRGGMVAVTEKTTWPKNEFRGVKFNLPWSAYRAGPAAEAQVATCRDLKFWEKFLDLIGAARFNALTLWNVHPFVYMIQPANFPKACPFTDEQLAGWREFWKKLFRMARERAIKPYVLNWNIVVSEEFARAYGAKAENDRSETVGRYTRECVTQLIDEYEDLAGFGAGLGDWMRGMDLPAQEEWTAKYLIAGVKAAQRKVEFIHRAPFSSAAAGPLRQTLDQAGLGGRVWAECKFNWSHGHSTSKLAITHNEEERGKIDEGLWKPEPSSYKIIWTVRNEDIFILRWGEPAFIRAHIAENARRCVGGYIVGSECFIPGKDVTHRRDGAARAHMTWEYAFEKQWLFWMMWGRLLWDPKTPEAVFEAAFEKRHGQGLGKKLVEAYRRASRMPLRLASFYRATWDYTLYAEMFCAPHEKGFLSVDELIGSKPLDPRYLSIPEQVALEAQGKEMPKGMVTPQALADEMEEDAKTVGILVKSLRWRVTEKNPGFGCELDDLETWAELTWYFAAKLRGALALQRYRLARLTDEKQRAVEFLEQAAGHWERVAAVTGAHYAPLVHANGEAYSWAGMWEAVRRDVEIAQRG